MKNEEEILRFLLDNFQLEQDSIGYETAILKTGLVDSTGMIEIVSFLEEKFGVVFEDEELTPKNFESISAMTMVLNQKLKS